MDRVRMLEVLALVMTAPAGAGLWFLVKELIGWWKGRTAERATAADQVLARTNQVTDQLQEELQRVYPLVALYMAEIELLRAARWQLMDAMGEVRDAAITARILVHEMQRRLGEDETEFAPLPTFPALGAGPRGPAP